MALITFGDKWMQDLRTLAIFVKVAERRSFVRAAADLGITQSGVSNAITRLEDQLGVRLLARTTRRVGLTEDGAAYFERCRQVLADLEEAELVLKQTRLRPTGRLRIDMPLSFDLKSFHCLAYSKHNIRTSSSSSASPTVMSI
jgi:LysR family transcriptional regulator for bpeEF and oprC